MNMAAKNSITTVGKNNHFSRGTVDIHMNISTQR